MKFFFIDSQFNSSRKKILKLNYMVQIFSMNGGQSHLKLQVAIQKKKILTLNAHIYLHI